MNKKQWIKRTLALALTLVMAMLAVTGYAEVLADAQPDAPGFGVTEAEVERRVYPYVKDFGNDEIERGEVALYFVNGGDIPYVALSEYMDLLADLLVNCAEREGIAYKVEQDGEHIYAVSRTDRNSVMSVNTESNLIWFLDFNSFTQRADVTASATMSDLPEPVEVDMGALFDALATMAPEEGEQYLIDTMNSRQPAPESLFTASSASVNRVGDPVSLNLSDYWIDIVEHDGECYIPLQTLNDLFMGSLYMRYVFNGVGLYAMPFGSDGLLEEVYQAEPQEMSGDFAQFNYYELMLLLDNFYGLKPEHDIKDFSSLLANTNLGWKLSSTKAEDVDAAITQLCMTYLDDLHSGFNARSWRSDPEAGGSFLDTISKMGYTNSSHSKSAELFANARRAAFPDGMPMYQEIGDTAFITFDVFTGQEASYYYHMDEPQADEFKIEFIDPEALQAQLTELIAEGKDPSELNLGQKEPADSIRLFNYAYKQITRENSPIKNVVIDLSNNGGGDSNAAAYVIAMVLGTANIALKDTFTGAETIMRIGADLELNEEYNSYDKALVPLGYKVWCLTCTNSFSCGNLVPAALKMSEQVPIIGQTSGGGSCVVLPCTTASGAMFQISGNLQLSTVRNGSFYNIDQGIEPDVPLMWPESFYDREALVEYLHTLK